MWLIQLWYWRNVNKSLCYAMSMQSLEITYFMHEMMQLSCFWPCWIAVKKGTDRQNRQFTDRFKSVFTSWKFHQGCSGLRAAECSSVTKVPPADCGRLLLGLHLSQEPLLCLQTRISVRCDLCVALPPGLLTSAQPAGSDLWPAEAVSSSCPGRGRCASLVKWHNLLCGSCVLIMNVSVCWFHKACLLSGCHGWKACVWQVNVLSVVFPLALLTLLVVFSGLQYWLYTVYWL